MLGAGCCCAARRLASRADHRRLARLPLIRTILMFIVPHCFAAISASCSGAGDAVDALAYPGRHDGDGRPPGCGAGTLERVRQGGKLSDALADIDGLPSMAVRMLKLGEETGQLPVLAGRIAEFFEAKLAAQPRSDRRHCRPGCRSSRSASWSEA